jgi:hypothetical protein
LNQQRFAEAESQVRWCLERTPGDQTMATMLRTALKGRLDSEHHVTAESEHAIAR